MESLWFYWLKKRIKDFLSNRFRLPVFDLSNRPWEFLGHFRTKKFDYINGYTSSIVLFKFYKTKHCFKDVCPTLKVCGTSETFLKRQNFSKNNWDSNYQRYGASELDCFSISKQTKGNGKSMQKLCLLKF
jgi:phenylacetate-CoA ligase